MGDNATTFHPRLDFVHEQREVLQLSGPDGQSLGATLHFPLTKPNTGTQHSVLLLPGWSGPRTGPAELLVHLAQRLAAAGHLVLRMDFHGRGDSSGRFEDCGLDRMIEDAALGLAFLRSRAPKPTGKWVAGGICSGANVALGLASLQPHELTNIIALSALPFQPSRGAVHERRRRWKNLKQYAAKALKPATWSKLARGEVNLQRVKGNLTATEKKGAGERNLKDSSRDIEKELLAWKGSALFLWGSGDEEAAPSRAHFERLHAAGCGGSAAFDFIAGANHNFYGKAWRDEIAERALAFLG